MSKYIKWALIALVVIVVFRIVSIRKKGQPVDIGSVSGFGSSHDCKPLEANRSKMFGYGTKDSNEVCYLQKWLNDYFSAGLAVDGNFGTKTNAALKSALPTAPATFSLDSLTI